MEMRQLGTTGIDIAPLVLGGNVFGWTLDKEGSFAVLDAFLDAGLNAIDTADVYYRYGGRAGGESETLIGEWMADRGVRDKVVIITKGGLSMGDGLEGLSPDYLPRACEASLRRLQTDYIDVYMAHRPDAKTPIADTLEAFQALIDAGKIGHAAASGYTAEQLAEAASGGGRARFEVVEPLYNLASRGEYEGPLEAFCAAHNLGVIPYFSLASGFLTGKFRNQAQLEGKERAAYAASYLTEANLALLGKMDTIAENHGATPAQVALAWLQARPSVAAPIASATSPAQLADIARSASLKLSADEIATLNG